MQRIYPQIFSPADDQDKDGFNFRCGNALKIGSLYFRSTFHLRITINISFSISDLKIN